MALSVLVALMMLAVPLASSSNLFVDGGQTNSNGDAPLLGADATGYTVTLKLSGDENSLDDMNYTTLTANGWYLNVDGDLFKTFKSTDSLNTVLADLFDVKGHTSKITREATKLNGAYELEAWKNAATNDIYDSYSDFPDNLKSDVTLIAQWKFDSENFVKVPITVDFDGEKTDYTKTYAIENDKISIVYGDLLGKTGAIFNHTDYNVYGIVVNYPVDSIATPTIVQIYKNGVLTAGDVTITDTKAVSKNSSLNVVFTFNDTLYSKLTVHSDAFEDKKDVMLYVYKGSPYSYVNVLMALSDDGITTIGSQNLADSGLSVALKLDEDYGDSSAKVPIDENGYAKTADGYYLLTGWDGSELLTSANTVPANTTELTLDTKLNGYYVLFMVNGQYETVYVPYGELSADLTKLNISDVTRWEYLVYDKTNNDKVTTDYLRMDKPAQFNFSSASQVEKIESLKNDGETPIAVFIGCSAPSGSTVYAVFDASTYSLAEKKYTSNKNGNFGNEYVKYMYIPGKSGDRIVLPAETPVYGENDKIIFISWNVMRGTLDDDGNLVSDSQLGSSYKSNDTYGDKTTLTEERHTFWANAKTYTHTITFCDGNNVTGIFYYDGMPSDKLGSTNLVAFEQNGKIYDAADIPDIGEEKLTDAQDAALKAYNKVVLPSKDGYYPKQWNDAQGTEMVTIKNKAVDTVDLDFNDEKDLKLYVEFKAETYKIIYKNPNNGSTLDQQNLTVDVAATLLGSIFTSDNYKLIGWTTTAGDSQVEYELGGQFTLTGAEYKEIAEKNNGSVIIYMYPVWENGGSDVPGGNTGGDSNDNTALYLIAGMLAVIAILAIVGIVLMRKK